MKKYLTFYLLIFFLNSCKKDTNVNMVSTSILSDYIRSESNQYALIKQLIACAASTDMADPEQRTFPISVFYYPVNGAFDIKYFEINNLESDYNNYENYAFKDLQHVPVFNGYLGRFKCNVPSDSWCIVTYKTPGKLHICNPIKIKHYSCPTLYAPQVISVRDDGIQPGFSWIDSTTSNNAIYFQVVSDSANNLISGTYTYDKQWVFYDLSNVVLNIRTVSPAPSLLRSKKYNFTLMSVSLENWVNLTGSKVFETR